MKKRIAYLFIYLFIALSTKAQVNLVPNYSFEDKYNYCFVQMGMLTLNPPPGANLYVKDWYSSSDFGTPDYYHVCANFFSGNPYPVMSTVPANCRGYQMPRTGDAYAGIGIYCVQTPTDSVNILVEPLSVKLSSALKPNVCYHAEFYASLADAADICVNQISMLLTQNTFTTALFSFTNTIQPQVQWDTTQFFTDTLNWVKISGTFMAQGGEEYLTISNFKDGAHVRKIFTNASWENCNPPTNPHASYIYIDDVALYELPQPQITNTAITLCPNADSLVLGDTARLHSRYQWYANGIPIDTTSYIKVKPTQNTTYVLQTTQCAVTTQSIVVTYSNNCEPVVVVEPTIPNVFTPNNDSVNDVWRFSLGKGNTLKQIDVYNRWGNLVYSTFNIQHFSFVSWDGYTTSGEPCNAGVYYYVLIYTDANGDEHKKNGYITLIK